MRLNLTPDCSLVAQVTFNNGSFINATVTIMRPINLNGGGGMIDCNRDTLTLNIPSNTGKFLVNGFGIEKQGQFALLKGIACLHHRFFRAHNHYKFHVIQ